MLKRVVKKARVHSTTNILFKEAPDAPAVSFTSTLTGGNDIDVIVDKFVKYISPDYTYTYQRNYQRIVFNK